MPPGFNELNYTSLRVIREVDDRDTKYELGPRTGVSQSSSRSPLTFSPLPLPLFLSFSVSPFHTKTTPRLIIVVSMLFSPELYRNTIYVQVLTSCHLVSLGKRRRSACIWIPDTYVT
ncbi:hypothetical protein ALC62_06811 [Cyphomyrmex costatus]|uniref:Uncharacterized protein n=1 Tax=Cyphomyrmex costatus TaxID=456900 RepID=A0A195CNZ2_9HYME|nr:hypothetical protein ALC62_06811 [Cyphomyrmex costatus]